MKLDSKAGAVTVTLTVDEAYAIFNFTHYAVRDNINWAWGGGDMLRELHVEDGQPTLGLKETRKLVKKLGEVCGWK